jgi:IclR family acetate operon transcriptional repressor
MAPHSNGSTESTPQAAQSAPGAGKRRTIQSVARALDIIELLSRAGDEMRLNDIASETGLNLSTCHHLIGTLVQRGFVAQNPRGRAYYLSGKLAELSSARARQLNLLEEAMPELRALNRETREAVHLAAMQGSDLVTLAHLDSPQPIRVGGDGVGKSSAAHATATGKAILAWLPETEMARVIGEKGLTRFTDQTITDIANLVEALRHVRRNGFAIDREEFQPGVICVGSAVRDQAGAVLGSISCSMPAMRADAVALEHVTSLVRRHAQAISQKFGSPASKA